LQIQNKTIVRNEQSDKDNGVVGVITLVLYGLMGNYRCTGRRLVSSSTLWYYLCTYGLFIQVKWSGYFQILHCTKQASSFMPVGNETEITNMNTTVCLLWIDSLARTIGEQVVELIIRRYNYLYDLSKKKWYKNEIWSIITPVKEFLIKNNTYGHNHTYPMDSDYRELPHQISSDNHRPELSKTLLPIYPILYVGFPWFALL